MFTTVARAFGVSALAALAGGLSPQLPPHPDLSGRWILVNSAPHQPLQGVEVANLLNETLIVSQHDSSLTLGSLTFTLDGSDVARPEGPATRAMWDHDAAVIVTTADDEHGLFTSSPTGNMPVRVTFEVKFVFRLEAPGILVVDEIRTVIGAHADVPFVAAALPSPKVFTSRYLKTQRHPALSGTWTRTRKTGNGVRNSPGDPLFGDMVTIALSDSTLRIGSTTFQIAGVENSNNPVTTKTYWDDTALVIVSSGDTNMTLGSHPGEPLRATHEQRYVLQLVSDGTLVVQDSSAITSVATTAFEVPTTVFNRLTTTSMYARSSGQK